MSAESGKEQVDIKGEPVALHGNKRSLFLSCPVPVITACLHELFNPRTIVGLGITISSL